MELSTKGRDVHSGCGWSRWCHNTEGSSRNQTQAAMSVSLPAWWFGGGLNKSSPQIPGCHVMLGPHGA
jgi:hypothetical protein